MEENAKQQLEGLLQARSEDMRHGRRPRRRQPVPGIAFERPLPPTDRASDAASVRRCEECGDEIGTRRLRAMPRASLCLDCQRSAERAAAAS